LLLQMTSTRAHVASGAKGEPAPSGDGAGSRARTRRVPPPCEAADWYPHAHARAHERTALMMVPSAALGAPRQTWPHEALVSAVTCRPGADLRCAGSTQSRQVRAWRGHPHAILSETAAGWSWRRRHLWWRCRWPIQSTLV